MSESMDQDQLQAAMDRAGTEARQDGLLKAAAYAYVLAVRGRELFGLIDEKIDIGGLQADFLARRTELVEFLQKDGSWELLGDAPEVAVDALIMESAVQYTVAILNSLVYGLTGEVSGEHQQWKDAYNRQTQE